MHIPRAEPGELEEPTGLVLVADDDPVLRKVARATLEQDGQVMLRTVCKSS